MGKQKSYIDYFRESMKSKAVPEEPLEEIRKRNEAQVQEQVAPQRRGVIEEGILRSLGITEPKKQTITTEQYVQNLAISELVKNEEKEVIRSLAKPQASFPNDVVAHYTRENIKRNLEKDQKKIIKANEQQDTRAKVLTEDEKREARNLGISEELASGDKVIGELVYEGVKGTITSFGEAGRKALESLKGFLDTGDLGKGVDFTIAGIETAINAIPAVVELNTVSPSIDYVVRGMSRDLGINEEVTSRLTQRALPFVFGKWVGSGALSSEIVTEGIKESGILNGLNPQNRQRVLDLTHNAIFFGVAGYGGHLKAKEQMSKVSAKELGKEKIELEKPEQTEQILKEAKPEADVQSSPKVENIKPEPLKTQEPIVESASVPFMVTKQMEADLKAKGYTQEQINKMKPQEANDILQGVKVEEPAKQPKPVEEVKPTEPLKTSDLPKEADIKKAEQELLKSPESPELVGITKDNMNRVREKIGIPELEQTARQEIPTTFEKVKSEIEAGIRTPDKLLESITIDKKLDPTQRFEGLHYLITENNRWNATYEALKEARASGDKALETSLNFIAEQTIDRMSKLTSALSEQSSDWGRFGRFTQLLADQNYTIARIFQRAEIKAPEGKVPVEIKTRLEEFASELSKVQKSYQALKEKGVVSTIEDFIVRAEREAKFQQRKTKRAITKEELKVEREQLWVDLYKASGQAGFSANRPFTTEQIRLMGQLAKNYVKDGIVTVEGLVDQFYTGFQGKVSKEDIMKALSGYGRETKPRTKDEVTTALKTAKQEMKLLLAIEDAKKGVQKPQKGRTPPPDRIATLQKLLKNVTKENIDLSDAQKLKAQKTRVKNRIADFEQQLKEKNFAKPERRTVQPDKEMIDLRIKENQLKKQIELELYRLQRMNMTTWEKTKELGAEIVNIPRTLLATADLSMPLRQALPATMSEPLLAYKAFKVMHKAGISEKYFKEIMAEIELSPLARVFEKMQIDFTGVGADLVKLAKREENFIASHILNKLPLLGSITKFSERGAVAYLNYMRYLMAKKQVDYLMAKGLTPENALKTYQDVGKVINWSTGRADLGALERLPAMATSIFFSPRNLVAKWQTMNITNNIKMGVWSPASKLLLKQQLATVAQGIMFLNMARLMGAEVETDPRSSDFGKIKIGDTRIDLWGGFQQNAVLLARMAYGVSGQPTMVSTTTGEEYDKEIGNLLIDYFRNKLSPPMAMGTDILFGSRYRGGDESFGNEVQQRIMPLVWQDFLEAQKELGWGALGTTLLGFYGAGTQTYKPEPRKKKINFNFDFNKKMKTNFNFQ